MPFSRPTLTEIRAQTAADIAGAQPGADPLLRFSNLGVIGAAVAGAAHGHYGYLDWIARQAAPFTATGEYLEGWAALKGVVRKSAVAAAGAATFTGTEASVLPLGAHVVRGDGVVYLTTAAGTVASGSVTVPIVADTPGAAGDAPSGVILTLGSAVAGVNSNGVSAGLILGGSDVEDDDGLRTRMLQAYAAPPQGGAAGDYVRWALEVAGVTRAWCVTEAMGPGTVTVYIMLDAAEDDHAGFPQGSDGVATDETRSGSTATGDQLAVADYIFPLRPVTALVYVAAPQPNTVTFTIAGLFGSSSTLKNAIRAAIADVFLSLGAPGGAVQRSFIESAVAGVPGSAGYIITSVTCDHGSVSAGLAGDISSDAGRLPVLGTVSFP